jgi:hypothetical protein
MPLRSLAAILTSVTATSFKSILSVLFVLCRTERSQCATAPVDVATPMQINDSTIEHQHDVCTEEQ